MDSTYILVMVIGVVLLFVPQAAWVGLAFLAIGTVAYTVSQKRPPRSVQSPPMFMRYYPEYQQPSQRAPEGVSWSLREQTPKRDELSTAQNPIGQAPPQGPQIKDGMFSLPLPFEDDVARFVNFKYQTPTSAKGFSMRRKKKNPLIPDF